MTTVSTINIRRINETYRHIVLYLTDFRYWVSSIFTLKKNLPLFKHPEIFQEK